MCGLIAYFQRADGPAMEPALLERMLATLRFRGPDARSTYCRDGIALAHARLSIIDLDGGGQPLFNEDDTVACVLNGEIYNYRTLRRHLEQDGHRFRSQSDTESLVHLYEQHGERAVSRTVGMFAYVIADYSKREMLVYRDRLGEKPLYFIDTPGYFACSSEIKALRGLAGSHFTLDRTALASYLRFGWIPAPGTIYRGVKKLEPGTFLKVTPSKTTQVRYWSAAPTEAPRPFDRHATIEELRSLLAETIPQKLIADVPTGVLLSGGLDSSAVVAFAQSAVAEPLRTYSAGFATAIDERPLARKVAERYGTAHSELVVGMNLVDDLNRITSYFDEPFADSSALPTLAVARAAREHVKVVLTGDGGDELFAGYGAYLSQRRYSDIAVLRKALSLYDRTLAAAAVSVFDPVPAIYGILGGSNSRRAWLRIRGAFDEDYVTRMAGASERIVDPQPQAGWGADPLSQAFEFDINFYLPDDLLKKVDMMTMLCGLEARAPLLDHRVVEFAMRIPPQQKLRRRTTKELLRGLLAPMLPDDVVHGEKQGFGAPLAAWLSGPLNELARDTLGPGALVRTLLDEELLTSSIERGWAELHSDWRAPGWIWSPLMLELWARQAADPDGPSPLVGV